ncbi:DNA-binding domain-containing protein, AraC-type [Opitutaceae bacterium TAV1]|nr:AraC family transcriptional regulator [Opitutaceae bacterium TAV5]EIP98585.1 DNA-binding domain-containing protein, AraC-type [Opitutaceae bacterium TAV1]
MIKVARSTLSADIVASLPFSRYIQGYRSPGAFHVFRYEESVDPRQVRTQPHRHDFFQMLWLEEGQGTLRCDLEEHAFTGQSLAFFAPGRLHAWNHRIEPRGIMLGFPHSFFHSDSDYPGLLGRLPFLHEPVVPILHFSGREATEMGQHFGQLLAEAARPLVGRDDIVRALITIILSKIRRHLETPGKPEPAHPAPAATSLAQRFRMALDQQFPRLLRVSDYAKLLNVSRSYLNEELRIHTGITASDHIHDRILLEAKRLLVYSPRTIAEIAYELQFQDPSYFSRFFRLRTTLSPGIYRQQEQQRLLRS